ncbi:MAG: hypothetical protein NZ929_01625 [Aigarchaeota archaeon]|nr:hypothetical protein [Aigarchaeota archaeon]MDW7986427.1 hypothetical protein [Nitrososphaerota archaeon]
MPYIKKEFRERLDPKIDGLVDELRKASLEELDGQVNYVIFRLLLHLYPPKYFNYNRALGVLSSVIQEFYRRHVAPYEDLKIAETGDIS